MFDNLFLQIAYSTDDEELANIILAVKKAEELTATQKMELEVFAETQVQSIRAIKMMDEYGKVIKGYQEILNTYEAFFVEKGLLDMDEVEGENKTTP